MLPALQQPLRLSMAARNPQLRLIAGGSRAFQTTPTGKAVAASRQGRKYRSTQLSIAYTTSIAPAAHWFSITRATDEALLGMVQSKRKKRGAVESSRVWCGFGFRTIF